MRTMTESPRCLYHNSFSGFLRDDENAILGLLCDHYHGDVRTTTREAWKGEISVMRELISQLKEKEGRIIFEYDIPRLGKRIDVVLLLNGIIFCLEFKVGESQILESDVDQVLDYALDLKNFHKFSQDKIIVPILVATEYRRASSEVKMSVYDDKVVNPLVTGESGLFGVISSVLQEYPHESPIDSRWIISPYAPTPTIIEAARSLYESHSVENITRHEADQVYTDRTISYILDVIRESKEQRKKSICFVTGVPGAGKTLVGLDVAIKQTYQGHDEPVEDEGAVYLSGNGPLVAVLTEALARDNYERCREQNIKKNKTDSRREVSKSIQMIHRYRDNMLAKIKNPVVDGILEIDPEKAVKMEKAGFGEVEHVAVFLGTGRVGIGGYQRRARPFDGGEQDPRRHLVRGNGGEVQIGGAEGRGRETPPEQGKPHRVVLVRRDIRRRRDFEVVPPDQPPEGEDLPVGGGGGRQDGVGAPAGIDLLGDLPESREIHGGDLRKEGGKLPVRAVRKGVLQIGDPRGLLRPETAVRRGIGGGSGFRFPYPAHRQTEPDEIADPEVPCQSRDLFGGGRGGEGGERGPDGLFRLGLGQNADGILLFPEKAKVFREDPCGIPGVAVGRFHRVRPDGSAGRSCRRGSPRARPPKAAAG